MTRSDVPGRGDLVQRVLTTLNRAHSVVLVGPAGVGKSSLATAVAARLERRDCHVISVRATRGASEVPLGPLLARVVTVANGAQRHRGLQFADVRDGIARQAAGRRVVFHVDDIDLLDDASTVFVHQALVAGEASLLATLRSTNLAPPELTDLVQRGEVERLDVEAFDEPTAAEVADAVAGIELDAGTKARLWDLCRGNALFIREVLTAARERGLISGSAPVRIDPLPVRSPNLVAVVENRLAELPPAHRSALAHLAFAEPCGWGEVASVADAAMLAELERRELVAAEIDGKRLRLRLAHPLYGEVIRAATGPLQMRTILATLARDLQRTGARRSSDLLQLGRLAVDGNVDIDPARLVLAASASYHGGDLTLAERIGRRAFEVTRSFTSGWDVLHALSACGELDAAREHLAEWRTVARHPGSQRAVALGESQVEYWLGGDDPRARAVLDAALRSFDGDGRGPTDDEGPIPRITVGELQASQALLDTASYRLEDALRVALPLIEGDDDHALVRAALAAAPALRVTGRPVTALQVLDRADAAFARLGPAGVSVSPRLLGRERALALCVLGRLDEAGAVAAEVGRDTVHEGHQALALLSLSIVERMSGRMRRSDDRVAQAMVLSGGVNRLGLARRWVQASAGFSRAARGDLAGAEEVIARLEAEDHPAKLTDVMLAYARATVLIQRRFPEQARDVLRAEADRNRAAGAFGDECFTLHLLGLFGGGHETAERAADAAARTEGPIFPLFAAYLRGVVARDIQTLGDVADGLAHLGLYRHATEAAVAATAASEHRVDRRLAARWLHRAEELRARCEMAPAVTTMTRGTATVTDREREIATMAAAGLSSKEIAARLFISPRTVDNHLGSVYVKLGLRTRAELREALGSAR